MIDSCVPTACVPFACFQANLGTAQLLVKALQQQGITAQAAKSRIWMVDSKGLILKTRTNLTLQKLGFAQDPNSLPGGRAAAAALESTASSSNSSSSSLGSSDYDDSDLVQQLAAVVAAVQPTALIGAAAVAGAFGQPVIAQLCKVRMSTDQATAHISRNGSCSAIHTTFMFAI